MSPMQDAGPTVWNSLPDYLREQLLNSNNLAGPEDVSVRWTFAALAHYRRYVIALYKSTFTYLLTYFCCAITPIGLHQ